MASIRISIGASLDRSVDVVFNQIADKSKRAARTVASNLQQVGRGGGAYRTMMRESDVAYSRIEASARRAARTADSELQKSLRNQARGFKQLGDIAARELGRQNRAQVRAKERFAERTSHRATRMFWPNAPIMSGARRIGSDLLRGAGVNFDVGQSVARNVALERSAIKLSNQGFQKGQVDRFGNATANASRVDPAALMGQARQLGGQFGTDPQEVLEALTRFTDVTGDLAQGRQVLTDMAALSAATGTDFGDMAEAAANVSTQLADGPEKGKKLAAVMKTIAGQGKLGAVEIKDMAKQMSRIAAAAPQFEGDVGTNIEKLGALAQLSRKLGGAPSAAEAARSVGGFASTLQKGARIKAFREKGIDVFADKEKTQFKDPFKLIKESLIATGGNLEEMNKLFMDVVGARAVKGLASTFSKAGGGQAGIDAVNKQIGELTKGASLGDEEISESNKRAQDSTAAKAQRFQNQLDEVTQKMQSELLPELEKLAPSAIAVVKAFSSIVTWAAQNPMQAVTAALVASIARAGIESAFRGAIEKALGMGGGTGGVVAGGGGGMGGILAATGAIVGLGLAADQASKLWKEMNAEVTGDKERAKRFMMDPEGARADFQRELAAGRNKKTLEEAGLVDEKGKFAGMTPEQASKFSPAEMASLIKNIEASVDPKGLEAITAGFAQTLAKTLNVRITNPDEIKAAAGTGVMTPATGRDPDPGRPRGAPAGARF